MPQDLWSLTDDETFTFAEPLAAAKSETMYPVEITRRRLRGGVSDGVDVVDVDNGRTRITLLPTRGMGIQCVTSGDVHLKWDSPTAGPVHPAYVPVTDPGGLGWLEGFTEWLVRCGLESNGSPEWDTEGRLRYPLHGRIANLPSHFLSLCVDRETGEISLTGRVHETKLFFKKLELTTTLTTQVGSSEFTVRDTVTNHSATPAEFQLLYHINTGMPFASPGGTVTVPFHTMAPRTPASTANLPTWDTLCPESPGSEEVVFFFEPATDADGLCHAMLATADKTRGLLLSFRPDELPYFSFWKCRMAHADGYVCGIEPATNLPNNRSFEKSHGRVMPLAPGASRTHTLRFRILHTAAEVAETHHLIRTIPASRTILHAPREEWTP